MITNLKISKKETTNYFIFVLTILFIFIFSSCEKDPQPGEVFEIVETMPKFPGGDQELLKYLYGNIKYPEEAKQNEIEGLVVSSFIVETDGSISNVEILRDIGGGCGEEVKRVIESMPTWIPGTQSGEPVRVAYKLPVRFKLE